MLDELGAGGMGIVLKAFDPGTRRTVAIKMIGGRADILASLQRGGRRSSSPALDQYQRIALIREARAVSELSHPNIVEVLDYGQQHGLLFVVMEYLEGKSLDRMIPGYTDIHLRTIVDVMSQVCDGLAYAHSRGLIHRDIKPSNIFVLPDRRVKIVDFGLAAKLTTLPALRPVVAGTPYYMAPEVFQGARYDARVDIWSAGVTLYQLLTGELPFVGSSTAILLREIMNSPVPPLDPSIPQKIELDAILRRALAKNPAQRFASADEFSSDLRSLEPTESWGRPLSADHSSVAEFNTVTVSPQRDPHDKLRFYIGLTDTIETVSIRSGQIRATKVKLKIRSLDRWRLLFISATALYLVAAFLPLVVPGSYFNNYRLLGSWGRFNLTWLLLLCAVGAPAVAAWGIAFTALTFAEKLAEIPRCRSCKGWMKDVSVWTGYVRNDTEASLGYADCLTALRSNLWQDAAKLLLAYGNESAPLHSDVLVSPAMRLQLAFFDCNLCCHQAARLTTQDKVYSNWTARSEYVEAHRAHRSKVATKRARIDRLYDELFVMARATVLTVTSLRINLRAVVLVLFFVSVAWYAMTHRPRYSPRQNYQHQKQFSKPDVR